MAKWIILDRPRDYQHASRAITAFDSGIAYYQPDHIADPLIEMGWATEVDKSGAPKVERMTIRDMAAEIKDVGDTLAARGVTNPFASRNG